METQPLNSENEFVAGSPVIYATHGRCLVMGTATRLIDGRQMKFYKLEIKRSSLSKSKRQEIWVPVATAKGSGLRLPMNREEAEKAVEILSSREFFFQIEESWSNILPQLELSIQQEGGLGLAKVANYLTGLSTRQVPTPEVTKFREVVQKLVLREISDALEEPIKNIELKIRKGPVKTKNQGMENLLKR